MTTHLQNKKESFSVDSISKYSKNSKEIAPSKCIFKSLS